MTVTYRDAVPGDGPTIDRLFNTVFCDAFSHLYRPEDLDAFLSSFGISDWEEQLSDPARAFRIAEADGEAVAYVKLGPLKFAVEAQGKSLLLEQLYVLREHHGAGVAQALMPEEVRIAANTIGDRITAQGDAGVASDSDASTAPMSSAARIEQVEGHYADACQQYRR